MNYMKQVADMLGQKLDVPFKVCGPGLHLPFEIFQTNEPRETLTVKLTKAGAVVCDDTREWVDCSLLTLLLNGTIKLHCPVQVIRFCYDENDNYVWAYLVKQERGCWWGCKVEEFADPKAIIDKQPGSKGKILEVVQREGFDPTSLPHIEDVDPLLKELWDNTSRSNNNMWFVMPEDVDEETISREEYEGRVDAAIKRYHLENIVVKNEDGALYVCYGNLQSMFSEKVGRPS